MLAEAIEIRVKFAVDGGCKLADQVDVEADIIDDDIPIEEAETAIGHAVILLIRGYNTGKGISMRAAESWPGGPRRLSVTSMSTRRGCHPSLRA